VFIICFFFMNYSSRSRRQCYHATAICFSAVCDFLCFFFVNQIPRERLSAFALFTCLHLQIHMEDVFVPRSDEFECQGQRSKIKVTAGTKNALCTPAACEWYALAANNVTQQRTGPFRRCRGGGGDFGGLRAVYVW